MDDITNKDLYKLIQEVIQSNVEIKEQNNIIREEIKQEFQTIKLDLYRELKTVKDENKKLREENNCLKLKITALESRTSIVERRQKKYNLIIYGLKEESEELTDIQNVLHIINTKLEIYCTFHDLRDIRRLGHQIENKTRPVVVEVVSYKLKLEILRNSKKLKGTGLYISQDYILEDYEKQKILYKYLKKARADNIPAKIKNNILIINGENFTVEDLLVQETTENQAFETPLSKEQEEIIVEEKESIESVLEEERQAQGTYLETKTFTGISRNKRKQNQPALNENPVKRSNRLKNTNPQF